MKIEWINHAGFLLEHGGVSMVSDPWIEGAVFDDGLDLLAPSAFCYQDFARATHLWFSHEHPDHFRPPNLMKIPPEIRAELTVLYQTTPKPALVEFCRKLGFKEIVELPAGEWVSLAPDLEIMIHPFGRGDSWMAIRGGGKLILNLNDCVVVDQDSADQVRAVLGDLEVDVVLSQYSYGGRPANRDQPELMRQAAARMRYNLQVQAATFRPRYMLPCASFSWFCHEENYYLNAHVNTIADVARWIRERCVGEPVILYPGDTWVVGARHNPGRALKRYKEAYKRVKKRRGLRRSEPAEIDDLRGYAEGFIERLHEANGAAMEAYKLAHLLDETWIWLTDHETCMSLSLEGLAPAERPAERCDVQLSSASLANCLRFPWGGDSLAINGRFYLPPRGVGYRFQIWFAVASHNYHTQSPVPQEVVLGAFQRYTQRQRAEGDAGDEERSEG